MRRLRRAALAAGIATGALGASGALAQAAAPAVTLPTGAKVVAGQANISQQGNVLTVQQGSARLATDWTSFSIGAGQTVNFVQPSSSSVALNRVVGNDVSRIQGALNSNGQVFLLNPNGVLFAPGAQVDVGGLVASTLKLGTADFLAGNYAFSGDSTAAVTNQGRITAAPGGTVALIAGRIVNSGSIVADRGQVLMGAGAEVVLDLGATVKLKVEKGAFDALIEQGGAVRADGGLVYFTAKAIGDLNRLVINHTGVSEARTLATGQSGQIVLLGDLAHDRISVGGTLDASAPQGGHGGTIETSAAKVDFQPGRVVTTHAADGNSGTWLIDPNDYTIAASGGDITGAQLAADLANGNVSIATASQGTAGGNGDIHVNDSVAWAANKLTLIAQRNIDVNASLTASGTASLSFQYGQATGDGAASSYTANNGAKIYIPGADAFTWKKGSAGAVTNLVFNNGNLRFGNGTQASINSSGQLLQPFYFDNTTAGRNGWYQLTYGNYPLNLALAAGGDGSSSWNVNGQVLSSQTNLAPALSNPSLEISGYHEGVGTVVAASTVNFTSGQSARLVNSYTVAPQSRYAQTETSLTNLSNSTLQNVRLWVGTQDDYVAAVDSPTKIKGNIDASGFTALSTANSGSNALQITERLDGTGAAVLFYSTSAGVDMVHDRCCSFSNVTNKDPRSSAIQATNDGSYAMFMRLADLAPGQSGAFTWYYAAAPASLLGSAITAVGQASGVASSVPVYLRLNPGSSVYGDTPTLGYSLFDSSVGGNLVSDAAPTGTVTWSTALNGSFNAGTYNLTYGGGIVLGSSAYTLTAGAAATWTILPRPLNLLVSKVYDGSVAVSTGFALTGMVNGNAAPTLSGTANLSSANAASYNSFASSSLALSDANYTLTGGTVAANVTPRPITLTADAKTKTYGDADPALSYQVSSGNLVGSDSLSGALTRTAGETAGSYTIAAGALANGNYAITVNNGLLTISPRPITVTADTKTKTYGDADPALSYQISSGNLVGGDSLSGALTRTAGETTGSYTIAADALANGNYAITANNGLLTISPRPLTVTVDAKGKTYGNADPGLSYQISSGTLVGTDALSGTLTRAPGESVGSYAIDANGLTNGNYALTVLDGTLTIAPAINANQLAGNLPTTAMLFASNAAGWQPGSSAGGLVLADSADRPGGTASVGLPNASSSTQAGPMRILVTAGGIRLPETLESGTTR